MQTQEDRVGILSAFLGEVLAIVAYVVLFTGVYKLFQIATTLGEIKELLATRSHSSPASLVKSSPADYHASDDASEYAAKLLRAVSAESQPSATEPAATPESN